MLLLIFLKKLRYFLLTPLNLSHLLYVHQNTRSEPSNAHVYYHISSENKNNPKTHRNRITFPRRKSWFWRKKNWRTWCNSCVTFNRLQFQWIVNFTIPQFYLLTIFTFFFSNSEVKAVQKSCLTHIYIETLINKFSKKTQQYSVLSFTNNELYLYFFHDISIYYL
jgi:hypothetical protein